MEHPEEHYYKVNRFFLSVSGLWPFQNLRNARIIRAAFTVYFLSSIFFQLASISTSKITMEYVIDLIPSLIPTIGSLLHMHARAISINKLKDLLERMWNDWAMQKTKDENKIMHESAKMSRLLTLYYTVPTFLMVGGYFMTTFSPEILDIILPINETRLRTRPFKVEYFIDEERYFYLLRSHMYISITLTTVIFTAGCSTFLTLTQHICGMCELIGYRAQRVVENATVCETRRRIAGLIHLHYNVIQFVSIIESFHTIPFLLDFVGVALTLSLTLTQILTIAGDMERAMRSVGNTFLNMYYIYLCNYMGQKITDMNWDIYKKIYSSAWYDAFVSEQKSLLLIMRRCFQPLVLTACKFYPLSLQSFGMILQTATSYCIFVRSI